MKTIMKNMVIMALLLSACTKIEKTTTTTTTNSPPTNDSLVDFTVSINNRLLNSNRMDTLKVDSAQGVQVQVSWKQTTNMVRLYLRITDSLPHPTNQWHAIENDTTSYIVHWPASVCPKKGWFKAVAQTKLQTDTVLAYVIIK